MAIADPAAVVPSRVPVWHGLEEVPAGHGRCVLTLGVFDGVHRGHARLIGEAVRLGESRGLPVVLVTFTPHPASVVGARKDTAALCSLGRRAELAAALGVDAICVLPFTREFAQLSPEKFAATVLARKLRADAVVVGENFTFGHRGAGTVDTLRRLGRRHGFTTFSAVLLREGDVRFSSTHIRDCLRRGDVRAATRALGRPHRVDGVLRDRELMVARGTALPAPGPYTALLAETRRVPVWVSERRTVAIEATDLPSGAVQLEFVGNRLAEVPPAPDRRRHDVSEPGRAVRSESR
ncbi:cytidyltransferase [Prauserella flavalba]|uniref:FAD synthase n=1 Tax=Prauserella flavalba TaxID=1477506 RepID=A0A318MCU9_9PSEU|nr:cytidyltransferase [Prauserella flavalba]PXY36709.1 hypothetical protein BA062_15240 [Prauserella flavalba]